jgi:S1-C subfamily serine protease
MSPATRLGNVTRSMAVDFLGAAGEDALELSFPALRGASGSPVLNQQLEVIGLVVANASYHLLPAQIESVIDEKNKVTEEIKYMLPQALAVNCKFIRAFIESYLDTNTAST